MENMYENLSDNLIRLRKSRNLTQAEFADIVKYSDKSISKWETGTSVPNLETLVVISEYYGITIDELIKKPVDSLDLITKEKIRTTSKWTIVILAILAIWLIFTTVFVYLAIRSNGEIIKWRLFIWPIPVSASIGIVFSALWRPKYIYIVSSLFLWTLLASIYLQWVDRNYYMIFFIGIPIQLIIIISRGLRRDMVEKKTKSLLEILRRKKNKE